MNEFQIMKSIFLMHLHCIFAPKQTYQTFLILLQDNEDRVVHHA